MVVTMPRFLVAQLNTHRAFSRNSASSRAIPSRLLRSQAVDSPFIPTAWPRNQAGMKGGDPVDERKALQARLIWLQGRNAAVEAHSQLEALGVAKEVCNRVLEPYQWTQVLITATDWDGFFAQRLPGHGAQGEMEQVAEAMYLALENSTPDLLHPGDWHLPFADDTDLGVAKWQSVARCARVSYGRQQEQKTVEEDRQRFDALRHSGHWSPFEHAAMALMIPKRCRNFRGWRQLRDEVEGE